MTLTRNRNSSQQLIYHANIIYILFPHCCSNISSYKDYFAHEIIFAPFFALFSLLLASSSDRTVDLLFTQHTSNYHSTRTASSSRFGWSKAVFSVLSHLVLFAHSSLLSSASAILLSLCASMLWPSVVYAVHTLSTASTLLLLCTTQVFAQLTRKSLVRSLFAAATLIVAISRVSLCYDELAEHLQCGVVRANSGCRCFPCRYLLTLLPCFAFYCRLFKVLARGTVVR